MRQRLITAAVLIPLVLACLLLGAPYSVLLGCLIYAAIQFEFSRFGIRLPTPYQNAYFVLSIAILPIVLIAGFAGLGFAVLLHSILMFIGFICIVEREPNSPAFDQLLISLGVASSYITLFGALIPYALWILPPLVTVWTVFVVSISDSGAYFGGSYFKGPALAPRISPNKTISGLLSGLTLAIVLGVVLGRYLFPDVSLAVLALGSLLIAVAGIFGDLAESLIKRTLNIKDSGTLLPGHGGVLDRVDALLFAVPCAILLCSLYQRFGLG